MQERYIHLMSPQNWFKILKYLLLYIEKRHYKGAKLLCIVRTILITVEIEINSLENYKKCVIKV